MQSNYLNAVQLIKGHGDPFYEVFAMSFLVYDFKIPPIAEKSIYLIAIV